MIRYTLLSFLLTAATTMVGQVATIGGGFSPNGLRGSHFNATIEFPLRGKFLLAGQYQMIKYTDIFQTANRPQPSLHLEYKEDQPIFDFPQLDRGVHLQRGEQEFRPRDYFHHFGLLLGYQLYQWRDLELVAFVGPHFSHSRYTLYNWEVPNTIGTLTLPDTGEVIPIQYHDYQIYREWDVGGAARADVRYAVFQNLAVGIHYMWSADFLAGGYDEVWGGSLIFKFGKDDE